MKVKLSKLALCACLKAFALAAVLALVIWPTKASPFELTAMVLSVLVGGGWLVGLKLGKKLFEDLRVWAIWLWVVLYWGLVLAIRLTVDLITRSPVGGGWDGWYEAEGMMLCVLIWTSSKCTVLARFDQDPSVPEIPHGRDACQELASVGEPSQADRLHTGGNGSPH